MCWEKVFFPLGRMRFGREPSEYYADVGDKWSFPYEDEIL